MCALCVQWCIRREINFDETHYYTLRRSTSPMHLYTPSGALAVDINQDTYLQYIIIMYIHTQ